MRAITEPTSEFPCDVLLWRLVKDASIAQVTLGVSDRRRYLQLDIDGATVFRCGFRPESGLGPLAALAGTTRQELVARGWSPAL
jgi:hypothetical protein